MLRLLLSILSLSMLIGPVRTRAATPIWPLDLPTRYLTSNFMEYRPGRFHAGLDLKTQTVMGFAARAVEDGWIVRVRATPTAYGRAVYLRGASGRTYVYAHLSRFNDRLRARLDAQRQRTGVYRARLTFKPNEIPVRQGEVLGLTGQSGTGGPHLHFEVRDERNRPTDPQALGFAVGDTMPPVIYQVRAWAVSPATRIEGATGSHLLSSETGLTGAQPAVHVAGPVAFSALIVDHADIRGHRLEPSLIELWLDGQRVYRCHNEHFDFAENALERLEWVVLPGVREHWLHRNPADTLAGREGRLWYLGEQGQGLPVGRHQVRILASDIAGNQTEVQFELVVSDKPVGGRATGSTAWQKAEVSPVVASADSLSFIRLTPFFEVDSEFVRAEDPSLVRYEFRPEKGDPVMAPLVVYSRRQKLSLAQTEAAAQQGLLPLAAGREFLAGTWPMEASLPVTVEAPAAAADSTWGLYRWRNDHWQWSDTWPGQAPAGGNASVTIDTPGLYAALRDNAPPVVAQPQMLEVGPGPASEFAGVTMPVWSVLPVGMRDAGSGLAAETITVHLDGQPLIVEPDLPRDRILIEFPSEMAPGSHNVLIEVADRVGRTARREFIVQAVR